MHSVRRDSDLAYQSIWNASYFVFLHMVKLQSCQKILPFFSINSRVLLCTQVVSLIFSLPCWQSLLTFFPFHYRFLVRYPFYPRKYLQPFLFLWIHGACWFLFCLKSLIFSKRSPKQTFFSFLLLSTIVYSTAPYRSFFWVIFWDLLR